MHPPADSQTMPHDGHRFVYRENTMKIVRILSIAAAIALSGGFASSGSAFGKSPTGVGTDPLTHVNPLPVPLEQIVQNVTRELAAKGYEVKRGYWTLWGTEQCKFTIHVLGRCFGPNPTAPYALPFVPAWRDEFVDPSLH